ncbi:MAG: type II toxin-antitoxin system HicA family toxin [Lachnospiraceae bacterium]
MPLTPKKMISLLRKNHFIIINQNGSHVKLKNLETGVQVIVPLHCKDLKKGLEHAILRQAGLK